MKRLLLLSLSALLSACANNWSVSGVPGVYEGQSQESVLKTLKKHNWTILDQRIDKEGNLALLAQGRPTKQFADLSGKDCRQGKFLILKKEGLQALYAGDCEK